MKLKTLIKGIFTLAGFIATQTFAGTIPSIEHWQTQNGAHVYFMRTTELPMIDIAAVFAAGSAYDGKHPGLAMLTNSLLAEGTKKHSADELATGFDELGAQFKTNIDQDMAVVMLRCLTKSDVLQPALDLFTEALAHSHFPVPSVDRIKKKQQIAIRSKQQDPSDVAEEALYRALYEKQPYAEPVLGTTDSVSALTRQNVIDFYHRFYVAKNLTLAIVGNLTDDQAKKIAETISKTLPNGQAASPLPLATPLAFSKTETIAFPATQTHIYLGQIGINRQDPDYFPLLVGNEILGGGSMVSRLFDEVRKKRGLSYTVYSGFNRLAARGPFYVYLQTRTNETEQAISVTKNAVEQFAKNGPTQDELDFAKQNMIGRFPTGLASNSDLLANLVNISFYRLPLDYLQTYPDKIKAVTREQVAGAFQKRIHPDKMVTVIAGHLTS